MRASRAGGGGLGMPDTSEFASFKETVNPARSLQPLRVEGLGVPLTLSVHLKSYVRPRLNQSRATSTKGFPETAVRSVFANVIGLGSKFTDFIDFG